MQLQSETQRVMSPNFTIEEFSSSSSTYRVQGQMITAVADRHVTVVKEKVTNNIITLITDNPLNTNRIPPDWEVVWQSSTI